MRDLSYIPDCRGNLGDWKARHRIAVRSPRADVERPFLTMLQGWLDYAKWYEVGFGSSIGEDYVLADAWYHIGTALNEMLNGDLGTRLDLGTLNTIINDNLTEQGWDVDAG